MNAKARRAGTPRPELDTHGARLLCGFGQCRHIVAWVPRMATQPVVAIPAGLTNDGTPGVYRWTRYSQDKMADGGSPAARRDSRPPGWSAARWREQGPVRFARVPCVVLCPDRHKNDVDTAVLESLT